MPFAFAWLRKSSEIKFADKRLSGTPTRPKAKAKAGRTTNGELAVEILERKKKQEEEGRNDEGWQLLPRHF